VSASCTVDVGARARRAGVDRSAHAVSATRVQDDVYEHVREQFSEDELVHLTLAIVSINGGTSSTSLRALCAATTWPATSRSCTRRVDRALRWTDGDEYSVTSGFELRLIERYHSRLELRVREGAQLSFA
jgi:hypothetical protein